MVEMRNSLILDSHAETQGGLSNLLCPDGPTLPGHVEGNHLQTLHARLRPRFRGGWCDRPDARVRALSFFIVCRNGNRFKQELCPVLQWGPFDVMEKACEKVLEVHFDLNT
ncbi:unnamed protein product [Pleuronectes platessa]|uniref:Uncharacterized protein n=1 Tax=Pleuronectes platessa TaxID=8262 RepID=A0A9N7VG95_PLEPL|nr:unnamed protein product [Pleuronectes platessa]